MDNVGTVDWHMDIIKTYAFRAKLIEGNEPFVVTIKVSGTRAKYFLEYYFRKHGMVHVQYRIRKLGLFECWFPRYQIKE